MLTRTQKLTAITCEYLSEKLNPNSSISYYVISVVRVSSTHDAILDLFELGRNKVPQIIINKLFTSASHNIS